MTLDPALLTTPFIASWLGRARPGDPFDTDPARRASAWAHWALTSLQALSGHADRPYVALTLPGKFYDPRGTAPVTRPHLEIPSGKFHHPDPLFPDRLAQAGNALHFPWWVIPEVLAVKRAILAPRPGDISALTDLLNTRRVALRDTLTQIEKAAVGNWSQIEELQLADPDALSRTASAPFDPDDVADYLPAASDLALRIEYDIKLMTGQPGRASRRVGVWTIRGGGDDPFTLGVLTPRLTRSSLFSDPLFSAETEAPAALLVRGLLLRRLLATHLGADAGQRIADAPGTATGAHLRTVVARVGEKLPEAGIASAVNFLQNYPDVDNAWTALTEWAATPVTGDGRPRALLAVTADDFRAAHRAALRAVRRAEDPDRDDINMLLPIAWDHQHRVIRVTFARPTRTD